MEKQLLVEILKKKFPEAEIINNKQYVEMTLPNAKLHQYAQILKNDHEFLFDYLFSLSGVDFQTYLSVVYHLESTHHNHQLVCKVMADNNNVDTVCDLWTTAEFHEREVYDLLGIHFNNHPDLRRLFLDEQWGFPLRKDYRDEINIIER